MTVAAQVKMTFISLKSAQASLEMFALSAQHPEAKAIFEACARQAQTVVDRMSVRVSQLEAEEPQYRGL